MPYAKEKKSLPEGFIDLSEKIGRAEVATIDITEGSDSEYHYPSLNFYNIKGLEKLPKEGTAIIQFKKVSERTEKVERNGKTETMHSIELCIHGIKPSGASSEVEVEEEEDDDDAIERGLEEAERDMEEEESEDESEEEED